MRFSNRYSKLEDRLFTTIRSHAMYHPGSVIKIDVKDGDSFYVKVLARFSMKFIDIPLPLLQYDTDLDYDNPELIIEEIRGLYKHSKPPEASDKVFIYLMLKVYGPE